MDSPKLSAEEQNRHDIIRFRISIGQLNKGYSDEDKLRDLLSIQTISEPRTWELIRDLLEDNPNNSDHLASAVLPRSKRDETELRAWLQRTLNCYSTLAGENMVKAHRHEHIISVIDGLGRYDLEFTPEQERKIAYGTFAYDSNRMQDIIVDDYSELDVRAAYTLLRERKMLDAIKDAEWRLLYAVKDRIVSGEIKRAAHLLAALNAKTSIALSEGAL